MTILNGDDNGNVLIGTPGDDAISGLGGDDQLVGGDGHDTLEGGAGIDILVGDAGDDILRGGAGTDGLAGGAGVDTISYSADGAGVTIDLATGGAAGGEAEGDGFDSIENVEGGRGDDRLIGSDLANILRGNAGIDQLAGGEGDDTLSGGAGADTLDGGADSDTASWFIGSAGVTVSLVSGVGLGGDAQGDTLIGIENLSGSQGHDRLIGDAGANTLQGWNGDDALGGAGGKDTLTGGLGADRFVYGSVAQSVVGADADRITDFSHAQDDRIDLAAIDANTLVAADQAFRFIGTGLYTHQAGELRFAVISPGVTAIAGDINGDGVSDFHIQLTGTITLMAADFVL
jgi:Ca2+-binding RTX toxin-like protein